MKNSVKIFVSGGSPEKVAQHIPDFIRYISGISHKARFPEKNIPTEKSFTNNFPCEMNLMIFGPEIVKMEYMHRNRFPIHIEVIPVNIEKEE